MTYVQMEAPYQPHEPSRDVVVAFAVCTFSNKNLAQKKKSSDMRRGLNKRKNNKGASTL